MNNKPSRWTSFSALIFSFIAGSINVIGLLDFEHQSVSHLSGTASMLSVHILESSHENVQHLAGIMFSFLFGAGLSGFFLYDNQAYVEKKYQVALYVEAFLILLSLYLLTIGAYAGHYSASAACGLQNSMAMTYSGAMVKTTHLTGTFTDLGIILGQAIKGIKFDKDKLVLLLILVVGFITGGIAGALFYNLLSYNSLMVPAILCIAIAVLHPYFVTVSDALQANQTVMEINRNATIVASEEDLYRGINQIPNFK